MVTSADALVVDPAFDDVVPPFGGGVVEVLDGVVLVVDVEPLLVPVVALDVALDVEPDVPLEVVPEPVVELELADEVVLVEQGAAEAIVAPPTNRLTVTGVDIWPLKRA